MNLGEKIREFRTHKGLTQEDLAKILSISPQAISKWERGESLPDATALPAIADALGVSLNRLFGQETSSFEDIAYEISNYMLPLSKQERFHNTKQIAQLCEYAIYTQSRSAEFHYPDYRHSTSVEGESGFTFDSNRPELPFFSVFLEPEAGWAAVLNPETNVQNSEPGDETPLKPNCSKAQSPLEGYREFFEILSEESALKTVFALLKLPREFSFDETYAASQFGLENPAIVLDRIEKLRILFSETIEIDGRETRIWFTQPKCGMVALLAMLNEYLYYNRFFDFQCGFRKEPYFR